VSYGQDPEVICLTRLAHTLWLLGEQDDAERARNRGLELADERGHPYSRAVAGVFAGVLALDQRDEQRLRRHADELASAARGYEAPQIRIVADLVAGLLELFGGGSSQAATRVRSIVLDALREDPATPGFHGMLMRIQLEACVAARDAQAGLAVADQALVMGGGTALWEAEFRRLRAAFLAALGAASQEVKAELERAIEVAQRQAARAFELRARADLDHRPPGTP
jgi:hypothetical protein